ncbi:hypothetical protein B296_00024855 [Ensete ventricosum]|uniref:Uncharacterized protein n=1 Tax=Ensete ventricosum TaxID=4639 RepID=A0A427AU62_ENSVE|nr:hypothetical protein B296_00024855 [Ensete ventricosum]
MSGHVAEARVGPSLGKDVPYKVSSQAAANRLASGRRNGFTGLNWPYYGGCGPTGPTRDPKRDVHGISKIQTTFSSYFLDTPVPPSILESVTRQVGPMWGLELPPGVTRVGDGMERRKYPIRVEDYQLFEAVGQGVSAQVIDSAQGIHSMAPEVMEQLHGYDFKWEKEEDLLAQKKMPYGKKEEISQVGVSYP